MTELTVNGVSRRCEAVDVAGLVRELDLGETAAGVAVAVNDQVVPRAEWPDRPLSNGDRVEILGAVQGG